MSEMEAIKSATSIASELIGMSDLMGSIQSGKLADIIAVSGNPLEDISTLKKVEVVIKEGVIYKN